ncbi:MAG: hypothetical protein CR975_07515, partial [Gammaproteobacteria bacterium]
NISHAKQLLDEAGTAVYHPDDRQKLLLNKAIDKLNEIRQAVIDERLWQLLYKITKIAKDQVKTVENYEYIWLAQFLAVLNIKGQLKTLDTDAQRMIAGLADYLGFIAESGETFATYAKAKIEVEWLRKTTGSDGNIIKNDYNPPKNRLFEENETLSIVFPISAETIEAIAFFVKKELATVKTTFENALLANQLDDSAVKSQLAEQLKPTWAVFEMLAFSSGIRLMLDAETLVRDRVLSDAANIEEFARNIVLVEDALWQLRFMDAGGLINSQDAVKQQKTHTLAMAVSGSIVITANVAKDFFKKTREHLLESFNEPTHMNMMRLAEQIHKIRAIATLLEQPSLTDKLQKTEQIHLFLSANDDKLCIDGVNNLYLDVLVTYEIIYEQLEKTISINARALKLLDEAQQNLAATIQFTREQMAEADYLTAHGAHDSLIHDDDTPELGDVPLSADEVDFDDYKTGEAKDAQVGSDKSATAQHSKDRTDVNSAAIDKKALEQALASHSHINHSIKSVAMNEVDDEILEIFIEEGEGIIAQLEQNIPKLQTDYHNREIIGEVRRAYHTLKGSGRMVGLHVFGEFAWQHEDLFNHAIADKLTLNDIAHSALLEANKLIVKIKRLY